CSTESDLRQSTALLAAGDDDSSVLWWLRDDFRRAPSRFERPTYRFVVTRLPKTGQGLIWNEALWGCTWVAPCRRRRRAVTGQTPFSSGQSELADSGKARPFNPQTAAHSMRRSPAPYKRTAR